MNFTIFSPRCRLKNFLIDFLRPIDVICNILSYQLANLTVFLMQPIGEFQIFPLHLISETHGFFFMRSMDEFHDFFPMTDWIVSWFFLLQIDEFRYFFLLPIGQFCGFFLATDKQILHIFLVTDRWISQFFRCDLLTNFAIFYCDWLTNLAIFSSCFECLIGKFCYLFLL